MQQQGQQWIMLSYCWGIRDSETGQYDMQQCVIKVFKRLVGVHGLPCWLDVFGGMGGDVYESMARGVRGAAVDDAHHHGDVVADGVRHEADVPHPEEATGRRRHRQ